MQETDRIDANEEEQAIRDEQIPQSGVLRQQLVCAQNYKSRSCRIDDDWNGLQRKRAPLACSFRCDPNSCHITHEEDGRDGGPARLGHDMAVTSLSNDSILVGLDCMAGVQDAQAERGG